MPFSSKVHPGGKRPWKSRSHLAVVVEWIGDGDVTVDTDATQMKQGCYNVRILCDEAGML